MKQPKKPTLAQKKAIKAAGLDWKNWGVVGEEADRLTIRNKQSGRERTLKK